MTTKSPYRDWACLMYHDTPARDSTDYFSVAGPSLKRQLDIMTRASLRGRSLESILESSGSERPVDGMVALSFDDGYRSNYEVALPLLAEHEATATLFVVSSWVGTTGYCTWSELRALQEAGWSIQSHTHSHPFLSQLRAADVRAELMTSREELEQHLGTPVVTLSLPNGDFPCAPLANLILDSGYQWVATSRWGPNGRAEVRAREIRRYTVRRTTTDERFEQLATGASAAFSTEGIRLSFLGGVRRALGPELYKSLRARALSIR